MKYNNIFMILGIYRQTAFQMDYPTLHYHPQSTKTTISSKTHAIPYLWKCHLCYTHIYKMS